MLLTPTEMERLTIYAAAELARKHKAKGLPLNHPEAVAYIADEILEGAREGRSVADLIAWGSTILTTDDVMPGVAHLMPMIQVEGTFPDGTKLVTVHDPIRPGKRTRAEDDVVPGEIIADDGDIELNAGRRKATLKVVNTGDRPIQIGSHYPFLRGQQGARFRPRSSASACISTFRPAPRCASSPARAKEVALVAFGGTARLLGLNGLTEGNWRSDADRREAALAARPRRAASREPEPHGQDEPHATMRHMYGPTTGDGDPPRRHLAARRGRARPRRLWRRVPAWRRQDAARRARHGRRLDQRRGRARHAAVQRRWSSIRCSASSRAISASRTAASSASARPATPPSWTALTRNLIVGAATTVRDCEGMIATPGAHRRARAFRSARSSASMPSARGITTMIGGSLGPITVGIDCGGAFNVGKMLQAARSSGRSISASSAAATRTAALDLSSR